MQRPQVLLVDLDGTLLDGSATQESIERTCRTLATDRLELDAGRLVAANGEVWGQYWLEVEDQWTRGEIGSASLRFEAWRRTLAVCGYHDEAMARRAADIHAAFTRDGYRLFSDAHDLVAAAREVGIRLALASNGAADVQREKLEVLGILDWFDAVVVSGAIGSAKPDAAFFQVALDQLGVAADRAWHVGDSLKSDVGGARAAGITAVWLNRTGAVRRNEDPSPDLEIGSLQDLACILAPRSI
jgi:HAD superfamily hydrolase (TIGR01549 family)